MNQDNDGKHRIIALRCIVLHCIALAVLTDIELAGGESIAELVEKACEQKNCGVALVHGASGTGKSILVQTALQSRSNAYWCSGKFDQNRISQPFSAIVEALSKLCNAFLNNESLKLELRIKLGGCSAALLGELIPSWWDGQNQTILGPFRRPERNGNWDRSRKS